MMQPRGCSCRRSQGQGASHKPSELLLRQPCGFQKEMSKKKRHERAARCGRFGLQLPFPLTPRGAPPESSRPRFCGHPFSRRGDGYDVRGDMGVLGPVDNGHGLAAHVKAPAPGLEDRRRQECSAHLTARNRRPRRAAGGGSQYGKPPYRAVERSFVGRQARRARRRRRRRRREGYS